MSKMIEGEAQYYYDFHPTTEDLMGETSFHSELILYLFSVLRWFHREGHCTIYSNLNFYQTTYPREYPIAPDVAVIKGVPHRPVRSWKVGRSGPAPDVVFEIASTETWEKDVQEKPTRYAHMGVREYFTYDPNEPLAWEDIPTRLLGWRLDKRTRRYRGIEPDAHGRLWSKELESWLVPDGDHVRLYDRSG